MSKRGSRSKMGTLGYTHNWQGKKKKKKKKKLDAIGYTQSDIKFPSIAS